MKGQKQMWISNAKIVNVFDKKVRDGCVRIENGRIAELCDRAVLSQDQAVYDARGRFLLPGLIDAHAHIEMSYLCARAFAEAVIAHGTTGAILDPHDMMNAKGIPGVKAMVEELSATPLKGYWMAPPCVPSAPAFEDAGCTVTPGIVKACVEELGMRGIAEAMDFNRVAAREPQMMEILEYARENSLRVDGHAPCLSGKALQKYTAAGPFSDHECIAVEEMLEKYALGMYVIIRKGSIAELIDLCGFLKQLPDLSRVLLSTDGSVNSNDLCEKGYMNFALRKLVEDGVDAIDAICMATINVAEAYRLDKVGAIVPGYAADLCLVEDLQSFRVTDTFIDGQRGPFAMPEYQYTVEICSINHRPMQSADFRWRQETSERANVLQVVDGTLETKLVVRDYPSEDIVTVSVINRYQEDGAHSLALLAGFGPFHGALAASTAQDTQNIIVVGSDSEDMALAANTIINENGGIVAVADGKVKSFVSLPIAGILSKLSARELAAQMSALKAQLKEQGCTLTDPLFAISLQIPLAVIPEGAVTNRGLLDISKGEFIPVFL
jgi:adenine deaminase